MDLVVTAIAALALGSGLGFLMSSYERYVDEHPELNETPEQRKKRKEIEKIKAALRYGLESGRLSPEEYERLYDEKVKARESQDADGSAAESDGTSHADGYSDGDSGGGDSGGGD